MSPQWNSEPEVRRAVLTLAGSLAVGLFLLALAVPGGDRDLGRLGLGLVPGVLVGAAVALTRLRLWVGVLLLVVVPWAVALLELAPFHHEALGETLVGFVFGSSTGFLFLTTGFELMALWLPLGLGVGAAIAWLNRHHVVATWRIDKLAIWDVPSVLFLAVSVALFVLNLVARHRVARARWQSRAATVTAVGPTRPRILGVLAVATILVVLVLGIAPFLFRTRDARCDDPTSAACTATRPSQSSSSSSSSSPPPAAEAPPPPPPPSWEYDVSARRVRRFFAALAPLTEAVLAGLVAVFAVIAVALPLLRRRRLRAWEQPDPALPPTRRVELRFHRCLVALHEHAGVDVDHARNDPRGFVDHARASPVADAVLDDAGWLALRRAAGVWQQVRFAGRGLPDDAEANMVVAMHDVLRPVHARRPWWLALLVAWRLPARPRPGW